MKQHWLALYSLSLTLLIPCTLLETTPSNGTCATGTDYYCGSCQSGGHQCSYCYDAYIDQGVCKTPEALIAFCDSYASASECKACKEGYELNSDKTACEALSVENCLVASTSDSSKCVVCANSALLESGVCSSEKTCENAHCSSCELKNEVEVCLGCEAGWVLNEQLSPAVCVMAKLKYWGCASVDSKGKCVMCSRGFYDGSLENEEVRCLQNALEPAKVWVRSAVVVGVFLVSFLKN